MSKLIIDASAWIEYFRGTEKGVKVAEFIRDNELFIASVTIAEVVSKFKRDKLDFFAAKTAMLSTAKIANLDENIAFYAGVLHAETRERNKKFSLSDALVLQTARSLNAKLITADYDFKGFKEAIII